ncbi:MAG: VWA domain-containing protein [Opitutales bacterium]
MGDYLFKDPWWFAALVLPAVFFWLRRRRRVPVLLVPFAAAWHRTSLTSRSQWPVLLGAGGLVLLVVALARPQRVQDRRQTSNKGYDIVLAIDLSGSMLAEDYEYHGERLNRLQAIKPVIQAFINDRPADRIGVVVFAGRAYTLSPLTFDHDWLARQVERLKINMVGFEDGTAIGDGLGVALTRLEQAQREANGKRQGAFIVLLTDGGNNRGSLAPMQAADLAKSRGIPIYTIGAGRDGFVPMPVFDDKGNQIAVRQMLSDLDEDSLRAIAADTGGHYFRAAESDTIRNAFTEIDRKQKIVFKAHSFLVTAELFYWPAGTGLFALLAGALLVRRPGRKEVAP